MLLLSSFPLKKILQKLLDLGNSGGASDQYNVMDLSLVHLGISKRLLHRLQGSSKQVCIELLEACSGDGGVEVHTVAERVNLDAGLRAGGQRPFGSFTGCTQTSHCPLTVTDVLVKFTSELRDEVVHHPVVKVLPTKVGVPCCGLHLKDPIVYGQNGDVKGSTTKIKYEDVSLMTHLRIQI